MAVWTVSRRVMLAGCVATPSCLRSAKARADEPVDPDRLQLPQPGDQLVEAGNDAGTTPLKPDDIGSRDVALAWAFDPQKKIPRDGSRLNMLVLMRFDPATLSDAGQRQMVSSHTPPSARISSVG